MCGKKKKNLKINFAETFLFGFGSKKKNYLKKLLFFSENEKNIAVKNVQNVKHKPQFQIGEKWKGKSFLCSMFEELIIRIV